MTSGHSKSPLVAREERRLRVVFQRAVLVAVAAGVGCGTTTTVFEDAGTADAGVDGASVDSGVADAAQVDAFDKCSATLYKPPVTDTCGDYYTYPCALPTGLTVRGDCYFAVNDCNALCPDIHYNCHAIVGYCSTNNGEAGVPVDGGGDSSTDDGGLATIDGVVVPDEAGTVIIDCSVCPGSAGRMPAAQPAAFQVVDGPRACLQLLSIVARCFRQHVGQGCLSRLVRRGTFAFFRRGVVFRHGHADLLRQVLDGIDETDARVLHQEADRIAMGAAAEAVIELLGRRYREARGLFRVERAQPGEVHPGPAQVDLAPDDLDDIDAGQQVLDECVRDHDTSLPVRVRTAGRGCSGRNDQITLTGSSAARRRM